MPSTTASVKPQVTRKSEATMYFSSSPFSISSQMPRDNIARCGKQIAVRQPDSESQTVRNSAAIPTGRTIRQEAHQDWPKVNSIGRVRRRCATSFHCDEFPNLSSSFRRGSHAYGCTRCRL